MSSKGEPASGDLPAGIATAMRDMVAQAGPLLPLRDAEQLDLLAGEGQGGKVSEEHIRQAPRGRGRPTGSRNKQTREVRSYILSRYSHPLEVLAQTYSRPAQMLAVELGCTVAQAQALQIRAAAEALPYLEGKMPQQIELGVHGDFNLLIPGVNIAPEEAVQAAQGTFVLANDDVIDGEWSSVPESENR